MGYQFTKFVEWHQFEGDFIINVVEDEHLANVLSGVVASKTVGDRKIKVQTVKWAAAVLNPGQILVFPKGDSALLRPAIDKTKIGPSLVVARATGLAEAGSAINFILVDGKMRFEINLKIAEKKGLKIDPKLIALSKIVD